MKIDLPRRSPAIPVLLIALMLSLFRQVNAQPADVVASCWEFLRQFDHLMLEVDNWDESESRHNLWRDLAFVKRASGMLDLYWLMACRAESSHDNEQIAAVRSVLAKTIAATEDRIRKIVVAVQTDNWAVSRARVEETAARTFEALSRFRSEVSSEAFPECEDVPRMADGLGEPIVLTYVRWRSRLYAFGKEWTATDTSIKYEPIPPGRYVVVANAIRAGVKGTAAPFDAKYQGDDFSDKRGLRWFVDLGEGNRGIHPDGGAPLTDGGIGIRDDDTSELFQAFVEHSDSEIIVNVVW
jgi:hypothetical protein